MIDLSLTPAEAAALVAQRVDEIRPARRAVRDPGVPALAVAIGGQPGAAKSTIQDRVQAALGWDLTASYDADDDADAHPRYQEAMRDGDLQAHDEVVRALPPELSKQCLDSLLSADPPYDVLTSAWMGNADQAKQVLDHLRGAGHRVVAVYVATNEADSLLAIAERYQRAKDTAGSGRWVDPRAHRAIYLGIPDAAHAVESLGYADDIYVVDRSGQVLFENHRLADGTLEREPGVRDAIVAGRNRPPTPEELRRFVATARSLRARGDELAEPVDELVREAMRRQVERPEAQPAPVAGPPLDDRLTVLRHVTGAGLAPPGAGTSHEATGGPAPGDGRGVRRDGGAGPRHKEGR
jgi:hypothetical protein